MFFFSCSLRCALKWNLVAIALIFVVDSEGTNGDCCMYNVATQECWLGYGLIESAWPNFAATCDSYYDLAHCAHLDRDEYMVWAGACASETVAYVCRETLDFRTSYFEALRLAFVSVSIEGVFFCIQLSFQSPITFCFLWKLMADSAIVELQKFVASLKNMNFNLLEPQKTWWLYDNQIKCIVISPE